MVLPKITSTIFFDNFIFTINFVIIIYKNIFYNLPKKMDISTNIEKNIGVR